MFAYLSKTYLKFFFLTLISLELIYTILDFLQNQHRVPSSANMQTLYVFYSSLNALNYVVPISILLAFIITSYSLLKTNRLIAFSTLGYSKKDIMKPFLLVGFIITLMYTALNFTQLAYAKDRAEAIKDGRYFSSSKEDIFLKHNNSYIYFEKIEPVQKNALNIKIYNFSDNGSLLSTLWAKSGRFVDGVWILDDVDITKTTDLKDSPISKEHQDSIKTLEGFEPKILNRIFEKNLTLSVFDAISTIKLFGSDNQDLGKIKTILYYQLFFPFFAPFLMAIIFFYTPLLPRYSNLNLVVFLQLLLTLSTWGVLFSLANLGMNLLIPPEIAVILPIGAIFILAVIYYNRLEKT
ncbi:MAG: LptF/LptG family permease [Campylobacterales bacterium]